MDKLEIPDYRGFAIELMSLCRRYNIELKASYLGGSWLCGANSSKLNFGDFEASPYKVQFGDESEAFFIKVTDNPDGQ